MTEKRALITGITGQDGSYLAELLLSKGYRVFGFVRQSSAGQNLANLDVCYRSWPDRLHLISGDMTDAASIHDAIEEAQPQEVYNLAAQSFVADSWKHPEYTIAVNQLGFQHILDSCRQINKDIRIYQASSSEMYGWGWFVDEGALDENSAMMPVSPYGVAKLAAHRMAEVYRQSYGMFICCGICFNHESPRRGRMFVTRKIAMGVAEIAHGIREKLVLGNVRPKRDWGFAADYVRAMPRMLAQDTPRDYVIATNEAHTVAEFLSLAGAVAGLSHTLMARTVTVDSPQFTRPTDPAWLQGDYRLAKEHISWEPHVKFRTLVELMVQTELIKAAERAKEIGVKRTAEHPQALTQRREEAKD